MTAPTPSSIEVNGYAIRDLRIAWGIQQTDLAGSVGITRSYLAHLEQGRKQRVSPPVLRALVDALKCNPKSLLANPHGSREVAA